MLKLSLVLVVLAGCARKEPICVLPVPKQEPSATSACDSAADCVVIELGCCDHCNGGRLTSVNKDHVAEATQELHDPGCEGTMCTELGCGEGVATCEDHVCGFEIAPLGN